MFNEGFKDKVNIYSLIYNSGRYTANHSSFDCENVQENILCRIRASNEIDTGKIIFESNTIIIKKGDGIYDFENDELYTVINIKKVYGKEKIHHITCYVRKSYEKVDVLNGPI